MSSARLSLAQQIALLEETAPADFDPEDVQITGVEQDTADASAARGHYLDVGPSALRKIHDSVADPKYDGRRTTRKQLMESDEEDAQSDEEDDDNQSSADEHEDLPSQSDPEGDASESEQVEHVSTSPPEKASEAPEDLSSTLRKNMDEDRRKGKAVSRQIAIWDSLLDARIRLQKSVTAANRLPINLLLSNESIGPPPRKRRRTQSIEIESSRDYMSQVDEASEAVATLQHTFHPYLIQTLTKWSSKIQAVAPSVLLPSNRGTFSNKSPHGLKSAVELVDEALQGADYEKILARTRVKRGKGVRVGKVVAEDGVDVEEDVDVEIFDDTDFYQQMLRDVIDARGRGNGLGGAEDWIGVQKQKKAKKKVDTKASKGRKLRYEVHEKLQNFMVPVPVQGSWHEEQVDELFASLLGKGFENPGGVYGADGEKVEEAEKRLEVELGEALKGGFRVFG
ncbi:hypothetical protein PILCRDRAFT_99127 [Piloderma croceum F 1598]|uniref:Protein BFR2 n=1 Tax=Piloderma croceum (strain F 1598) TaxID=765440 RepID=A0A0C3EQ35_PILCF|nr:hypothetical protein PILCRDRAFT_99127 [Piloderma croceum F 1598]